MTRSELPRFGVVILTQGRRPAELIRAVSSVLDQTGVEAEVVVVGNGWDPAAAAPRLPARVKTVSLAENLGIPAGRNHGVDAVSGDLLFFLDDDASLPDPGFLAAGATLLAADPGIGLIQPRVVDPDHGTSRQWIPRMRKGDPTDSGNIFSCWEGAILIRREVFVALGGWAGEFFYAHEGIELAWRVWDQGLRAWYAGGLVANHPQIQQTRHTDYYRLNARNRVWLARRNLPLPFIPLYVGSWTGVQLLRWAGRPGVLRTWFGGWFEGWRTDPGERRPMRWRTIIRMTLAGRPPVV
ncbi:MAG TPA: glycosyltransferase [Mycobacteriales bacterium]|nr:glycosyltransferase [Mycobacteriales bacterium]